MTVPEPEPVEHPAAALQAALATLRSQGAQQLDPAGFHYLEVLLQRLPTQPETVRHILQARLQQALADYTLRFTQAHAAASDVVLKLSRQHPERTPALRRLLALGDTKAIHHMAQTTAAVATPTPPTPLAQLVQLNQHIRAARQPDEAPATMARTELASVRQFRASWSRHQAVDQVQHAERRGPENAGPLNSQMLVIHSLALMRSLSPHYLQRFMAHVDALLWLEQASAQLPTTKAQKKPPSAQKKSTRKK